MKKKIYKIYLPNDYGEFWLDENLSPLSWIDSNDGNFRSEYYGFILEYGNLELEEFNISLTEKQIEKIADNAGDLEAMFKVIEKKIKTKLKT